MLYDYYKYFLNYLMLLYGGSYEVKDHMLFLYCGNDEFKVSLFDGSRFGKYTFFHKNTTNKGYFHKQLECRDLEYGLFRCFTHDFGKKYGIPYHLDDWKRFEKDALKYKIKELPL